MAEHGNDSDEKLQVQVKNESAGTAARKLTVTIPADQVDQKFETSIGALNSQAVVPGFRKGRVPKALLEKRFGKALGEEARRELISQAYSQAIQDESIDPVGEPEIHDEESLPELERGKSFEFSFTIEVMPEFDIPEFGSIKVSKPMMEISDEHISAEITRTQYRFGNGERTKGPLEAMDKVMGPVKVVIEGSDEVFFENDQIVVVVPSPDEDEGQGQVLGLIIDGLAEMMIGKSVPCEIELETVGPKGHEREEIRDKKLTITFSAREAERITPLTVEQLVEQLGIGSEENLREQVRMMLENRRDQEQRSAMREQVSDHLSETVKFELPEKLTSQQINRTMERQRMELIYQGLEAEEVETQLARMRGDTEDKAVKRLKLLFILTRIAKDMDITVGDDEINSRIAYMASQRGVRPDQLRNELQKSGGLGEIGLQIREHKAIDRIIDQAEVSEIPAEQWNEQFSGGQGGSPSGSKKKTKKKTTKKSTKKTSKKASGKSE